MSVEEYLSYYINTKQLCREAFPDLFFGDSEFSDHVSVSGIARPARFVRVRHPETRPLHLRQIEIFVERDGVPINVAPQADLAVSSIWPDSEWMIEKKIVLLPTSHRYGFHTEAEHSPWISIDLARPEMITQLRVYNRTDEFAYRAWGIVIETSLDGQAWFEEYSYASREAAFRSVLDGRRRHAVAPIPPAEAKAAFDEVLFRRHSARLIEEVFAHLELSPDVRRSLFRVLNDQELFRHRLELTNHGVKQTFRFWSHSQKSQYVANAGEIIRVLRSLGLEACLGYGGVLSVVRDQDLMPHDDDVDVIVSVPREAYPTMEDFIADVGGKLQERGFQVVGRFVSHRHVLRPDWPALVDVFFGFSDGQEVSWFPGPRHGLARDSVFPPISCTFLGNEILIPRNPFRYLEHVYGPSWARPQPGWNHSWIESEYADWFRPPG